MQPNLRPWGTDMAARTDLALLNCSLARALAAAGDGWSMLIARDAFLGARRFGEFRLSLGIAKNILADRLAHLVGHGILERSGPARRPRYALTEKGEALLPALLALMQWGDRWQSADKPPILVTDAGGKPVAPVAVRGARRALEAREVRFQPGPGASKRTGAYIKLMQARGSRS
jgi:DNA-binding HxlR family transcriptional regulator